MVIVEREKAHFNKGKTSERTMFRMSRDLPRPAGVERTGQRQTLDGWSREIKKDVLMIEIFKCEEQS